MSAKFRLYPTDIQIEGCRRHCADSRFVWNLALEQRNLYRPHRTARINWASQSAELTEARAEYDWLRAGSSESQVAALRDLEQAFKRWWRGTAGRPTWRVAGTHEAFVVRRPTIREINRRWAMINVPKIGFVKLRLTRPFSVLEGTKTARVKLDPSGRWWVSFVAAPVPFERSATGATIGLDMGIATTIATSDGDHLRMQALLTPGEAQRKRRLQRHMARQAKGSNRRTQTKRSIARLVCREADRRKDWIEQTTTRLVREHDFIALENLKITNMVHANRGLSRSIHSQAWGQFRTRLTDKASAATSPTEVVAVNPAFTSQRCSGCGHVARASRESQSRYLCVACGYTDNADVNAAMNILAAGLAVTGRGGLPAVSGPAKRQPLISQRIR